MGINSTSFNDILKNSRFVIQKYKWFSFLLLVQFLNTGIILFKAIAFNYTFLLASDMNLLVSFYGLDGFFEIFHSDLNQRMMQEIGFIFKQVTQTGSARFSNDEDHPEGSVHNLPTSVKMERGNSLRIAGAGRSSKKLPNATELTPTVKMYQKSAVIVE